MPRAIPALLLVATSLAACASQPAPAEAVREEHHLYAANVQEWVGAMESGMERARHDLALRYLRRMMMEKPS